jgi:hypothetical protein
MMGWCVGNLGWGDTEIRATARKLDGILAMLANHYRACDTFSMYCVRHMTKLRFATRSSSLAAGLTALILVTGGRAVSQEASRPETTAPARERAAHEFARWETAIAAFEAADRVNAPPKEAVLFVGASHDHTLEDASAGLPGA